MDQGISEIVDKWLPDMETPSLDARAVSLRAAIEEALSTQSAELDALRASLVEADRLLDMRAAVIDKGLNDSAADYQTMNELRADNDALRGEVEQLTTKLNNERMDREALRAEASLKLTTAEATITQLSARVAGLKSYTQHKNNVHDRVCRLAAGVGSCDCGLSALLSQNEVG